MNKDVSTYNIKMISDKATYEKVGEYRVETLEEHGIRTIESTILINDVQIEKNQVICNSESLIPIESQIFIKNGDMDIILQSYYKKNTVELLAKTPKGLHKKKLKTKEIPYDNLQVYDLIGKLDFTKQKKYRLSILNIHTSVTEDYEVLYCCAEEVKLGSKVYPCIRLSLSKVIDCTEKQFLLYLDCNDRRLIRAINKGQILEYFDGIES